MEGNRAFQYETDTLYTFIFVAFIETLQTLSDNSYFVMCRVWFFILIILCQNKRIVLQKCSPKKIEVKL